MCIIYQILIEKINMFNLDFLVCYLIALLVGYAFCDGLDKIFWIFDVEEEKFSFILNLIYHYVTIFLTFELYIEWGAKIRCLVLHLF